LKAESATVQDQDLQLLEQLSSARIRLLEQVGHRIVGQRDILDGILTAILSRGHALLVGVPGLAKTLMVSSLAEALELEFSRIQFTPDLMPGDITGTEILEEDASTGRRAFRFVHGPVFANVVLADEINRTPPKTQAALLQAMQEHEVTAAGSTYHLPEPFFVLATQNPIDQEGTYPLPEAQLDRFMLQLTVKYPTREEEETIVEETTGDTVRSVEPVLDGETLLSLQHLVRRIPAPKPVVQAAVRLTRMTRPSDENAPPEIKEFVDWGAGPRASQYLVLGAKARAAMDGRPVADLEDVESVALTTLRHRVMANFAAEAAGRTSEDLCRQLIDARTWEGEGRR
jgi:MoxR-like ATPase